MDATFKNTPSFPRQDILITTPLNDYKKYTVVWFGG